MITPNKNILLTGAGFTKDFGGYLGSEMWSVIFNQEEISHYPRLRELMLREFDYERAYSLVTDMKDHLAFKEEEKQAFTIAIQKSYRQMHESICSGQTTKYMFAENLFQILVHRFGGYVTNGGEILERGFFFTLNQDLFLENFYSPPECLSRTLSIPGIPNPSPNWFEGRPRCPLQEQDWVKLPTEEEIHNLASHFWESYEGPFVYIKLHGSYGWESEVGPEAMVIGGQKSSLIEGEPLLRWYFSLFKQVLHRLNCNLVVIGYSFRDPHINSVILEAIHKYSLRVFVISPEDPGSFRSKFTGPTAMRDFFASSEGSQIWEGLHGYYFGTAQGLCDGDRRGDLSPMGKTLFRNLGLVE